jgi:hypothetical protein
MPIIDADTHLFERPDTWRLHADPKRRDLALSIENDELGWPWLVHRGRRLMQCWLSVPGRPETMGSLEGRMKGERCPFDYRSDMPLEYAEPGERRKRLEEWALDGAVLFPNFGLVWELFLGEDLESARVNMSAWNRWIVDGCKDGRGRLHPVGHVSLRGDLGWLEKELKLLSAGGVRLARFSLGLQDGKRLSHPSLERAWSLFVEHGVSPMFHFGAAPNRPIADAWFDNDPRGYAPMFYIPFLALEAQVALTDLVLNGVFDRHPALMIGLVEYRATWVEDLIRKLDSAYDHYAGVTGFRPCPLKLRPGDYVRRQVRLVPFVSDNPQAIMQKIGPILMFGSDFPHAEGYASPTDYRTAIGSMDASAEGKFYGDNLAALLGTPRQR